MALIFGWLMLALGALALVPAENAVHRLPEYSARWVAEHIYLPLARVALLLAFLYAAYPAPMFNAEVLAAADHARPLPYPRFSDLLNLLFLTGLLLPLLPLLQRLTALVLPVQALVGAWVFVGALERGTGLALHLDLTAPQLLWWAGLVLVSHWGLLALGRWLQRERGWDALSSYDALALAVQPPLVLLMTRAVGV